MRVACVIVRVLVDFIAQLFYDFIRCGLAVVGALIEPGHIRKVKFSLDIEGNYQCFLCGMHRFRHDLGLNGRFIEDSGFFPYVLLVFFLRFNGSEQRCVGIP
ncbi:hypothetical protein SDC9_197478 [bioreactor metagenome]|uniref:Uncharacterized protein n=1 Tax=bioreactor metagenome TaxID=1076179 RepID=A0A645INE3_9ZZZZ